MTNVETPPPAITDLVIEDVKGRAVLGMKRYGKLLTAFSGKDGLQEAYEEALDLCVYLRMEIEERKRPVPGVDFFDPTKEP